MELSSQIDIELHVKEVEKMGTGTETENSSYSLAGSDHFKMKVLVELKNIKDKVFEDMV